MAKDKLKKKNKIHYDLKILDWYPSFSFGVEEKYIQRILNERISESSTLSFSCEIESPKIKNVTSCSLIVYSSFGFEVGMRDGTLEDKIEKIGLMEKKRGGQGLFLFIKLPNYLFDNLLLSVGFNRITGISIYADRLHYGKGNIYNIYFNIS